MKTAIWNSLMKNSRKHLLHLKAINKLKTDLLIAIRVQLAAQEKYFNNGCKMLVNVSRR
jgi:hypothetical protein